jgi:hypothetical protein
MIIRTAGGAGASGKRTRPVAACDCSPPGAIPALPGLNILGGLSTAAGRSDVEALTSSLRLRWGTHRYQSGNVSRREPGASRRYGSWLRVPLRRIQTRCMGTPETRYARSGDVAVAYQVLGDGPFDAVFAPGSVSHVELNWEVPSVAALLRCDVVLSPAWLEACAEAYVQATDRTQPAVSPLRADLGGLPPLLIQCGTDDLLAPDAERLAVRARAAGVDVTYSRWAGSALAAGGWTIVTERPLSPIPTNFGSDGACLCSGSSSLSGSSNLSAREACSSPRWATSCSSCSFAVHPSRVDSEQSSQVAALTAACGPSADAFRIVVGRCLTPTLDVVVDVPLATR